MLDLLNFVWGHPLNRRHRMRALSRMVRWQLAARVLPEALFGLPFVGDTRLFMKRGMTGATGNWYAGLHECNEMAFVLHLLRSDDIFVDIGANVGAYSLIAAGGAGAMVIAVEPVPATFEHLQDNVRLNRLNDRVALHCIGLSSSSGTLRFSATQDTVNHVLVDGENVESVILEVRTLDSVLAGRQPTMIKMDVEGYEREVLLGAKESLNSRNLVAVLMETNGSGVRYGVEDSDLIAIMRDHGFMPCVYDAMTRKLTRAVGESNTIFVRDVEDVQSRVAVKGLTRLVNGLV